MKIKTLRILGARGIPACHGGFETFAEFLALYLVDRGWRVIVYCQNEGVDPIYEDLWLGVERVHISVPQKGPKGTIFFDWQATAHAGRFKDLCLTLGYNTAVFCLLLRIRGVPNLINMDGIEWARAKWGVFSKTWFWLNEWAGCFLANHLIADHPMIKKHLCSRVNDQKITMIPYGADIVTNAPIEPIVPLGLKSRQYLIVVARAEPENSLLEIIGGFSSKLRGLNLVVLGKYEPDKNSYHRAVMEAASPEVIFVGAIYDKLLVRSLRFHSVAYLHGHQVGGTNPSLIEAMGSGNAVIAHDNQFNRWVAGDSALYFNGTEDCSHKIDEILGSENKILSNRAGMINRHSNIFTWGKILSDYEVLLTKWLPKK